MYQFLMASSIRGWTTATDTLVVFPIPAEFTHCGLEQLLIVNQSLRLFTPSECICNLSFETDVVVLVLQNSFPWSSCLSYNRNRNSSLNFSSNFPI